MRLSLITLVAAALALAAFSAVAAAAPPTAPGVHIDPGSPVAKEYAIPLQQARGGSSGGSGGGQLFGSGITRAPTTPTSAPAVAAPAPTAAVTPSKPPPHRVHRTTVHRHRRVRPSTRPAATLSHAPATPVVQLPGASRATGGGAGLAWMVGVAALVLALVGMGGAALTRHSRRASTRTS